MQDNSRQYIAIMVQSLQQKSDVLSQIIVETKEQMEILKQEKLDFEAYDVKVDKKSALISTLEQLDEGFDSLYNKVQDLLTSAGGRDKYRSEIKQMQQLITMITEQSTEIQALEARNKQMLEAGIAASRRQLRSNKTTSKAAMDYYKNMRQTNVITPQFLDSKK